MKNFKNLLATIMVALVGFIMIPVTVNAEVLQGELDPGEYYSLDTDEGVLTLSGNGVYRGAINKIDGYNKKLVNSVRTIVISEGISVITEMPFNNMTNLESIVIPSTMTSIPGSFDIPGYQHTTLELPAWVTGIQDLAFSSSSFARVKLHDGVVSMDSGVFGPRPRTFLCTNDYQVDWCIDGNRSFIDLRTMNDLAASEVTASDCVATGSALEPEVVVTVNNVKLTSDDYDVSFTNNVAVGTATATVTGKGYFTGSKSVNFQITKPIVDCNAISNANAIYVYSGANNTLPIEVYDDSKKLNEGSDYELSYSDSVNAGQVTVTITGKGFYTGMAQMKYNVAAADISRATVTLSETTVLSTGSPITPVATVVMSGKTLVEGKDYNVVYSNNEYKGTGVVTINGINNYAGSKEVTFSITSYDFTECDVKLEHTVFTFTGSKKFPKVNVTSKDGVALTEGVDYVIDYVNNINEGNATVIVSGINNWDGDVACNFVITAYSNGTDLAYEYGEAFLDGDLLYGVVDDENNEVEVYGITNSKLRKVVIPATITVDGVNYKVTGIGPNAFKGNKKITSVTIGKYVTSIESNAFYGCTKLTTVKMGGRVELFGAGCFRKCTSLASITLPKSLEEIGANAFYGCKNLKSITIKTDDIEEIGKNAFKGINSKTKITVPKKAVKSMKKQFKKSTGYKSSMKIKAAK